MRRRDFVALVSGAAVAWPFTARAQQVVGKTARIGLLETSPENPIVQLGHPVFINELKKSGFIEGQNLTRNCEDRSGQQEAFCPNLRDGAVEC